MSDIFYASIQPVVMGFIMGFGCARWGAELSIWRSIFWGVLLALACEVVALYG